MKHRGTFLLLLILIPLIILALKVFTLPKQEAPPKKTAKESPLKCPNCNVILIGIDTLRADHLSSYGYFRKTSPNIDKLAEKGVLFKNAYSQAGKTTPSFMSILTSLYPSDHGVRYPLGGLIGDTKDFVQIHPKIQTLPQILKQSGYKTYGIISSLQLLEQIGFNRGFNEYNIGPTDVQRNNLLSFFPRHKNEKFFLFYHDMGPHSPYLPPTPYDRLFDPSYTGNIPYKGDIKIPKELLDKPNDSEEKKAVKRELRTQFEEKIFWENVDEKNPQDITHLQALYDGKIKQFDDFFGKIQQVLEKEGLFKNTIIIILSDHGEEFYEHGRNDHRQLYNEILKVPLIVFRPTLKKKGVISETVQTVDIMPTIFDLVEISSQVPMRGETLLSLIENPSLRKDRPIIAQQYENSEAFILDGYKYIKQLTQEKRDELYNLQKDLLEKTNVARFDPKKLQELKDGLKNIIGKSKYVKIPTPITIKLKKNEIENLKSLGY